MKLYGIDWYTMEHNMFDDHVSHANGDGKLFDNIEEARQEYARILNMLLAKERTGENPKAHARHFSRWCYIEDGKSHVLGLERRLYEIELLEYDYDVK